jgi:hypothetical protein
MIAYPNANSYYSIVLASILGHSTPVLRNLQLLSNNKSSTKLGIFLKLVFLCWFRLPRKMLLKGEQDHTETGLNDVYRRTKRSFVVVVPGLREEAWGQCCGSGAFFDPWSRDPEWVKNQDPNPGSRSELNNPDHISESLETIFLVSNTGTYIL